MRVLLVDDERHARDDLRNLLLAHPEVEVVGEAANAMEARDQLKSLRPDLVFLDIRMPEESGLELLASLGGQAPKVIFTTAYDAYAVQAFDFGAVDYLLKPVSPARLKRALQRLASSAEGGGAEAEPETNTPVQRLRPGDKILISDGEKIWYPPLSAVIGAEALGAHSSIWLEAASPVIRRSLAFLESRLPEELFFRANRSQLISLRHIESVVPWFSGCLKLNLSGGRSVELSRRQAKIFRERNSI